MTNYHSPWRFPALRVFTEENPSEILGEKPSGVRAAGLWEAAATTGNSVGVEPVSRKLARYYDSE